MIKRPKTLSLIGLFKFNPLEAFQKNQKDGFFIEAGFGLLEGAQTKAKEQYDGKKSCISITKGIYP
ncbi:hypothetical protein [Helicobacter pylori]|uniref:hypothetical protein n=1 Tax=Helicobacter pylori TaxID=210 RepID=UPI001601ACEF|nr:hypothetical protein [Helicobacter pylori]